MYNGYPERIEEDFFSEAELTDSQRGRYILELLQNADDAQEKELEEKSERVGGKKIIFDITDDSLYCANGGYQITKEGLDAICGAFKGPKRKNSNTIGYKGVGFKSVLAFTDCPEIFCGGTGVYFSRKDTYNAILNSNSTLAEKLGLTEDGVSTLRYPNFKDAIGASKNNRRLEELLKEYATIFLFKFKDSPAKNDVTKYLKEIAPATLLFLNNLEEVDIKTTTFNVNYTIKRSDYKEVNVNDEQYSSCNAEIKFDGNSDNWHVISGTYKIPQEIKDKLPHTWKETEAVKISYAIALETNSNKPKPLSNRQFLHVFFPTDHQLPLRIILHGTFRPNIDRRALVPNDPLNDFMIIKAIELLGDRVLPFISKAVDDPGAVMDFLDLQVSTENQNLDNVEKSILSNMRESLAKREFVPNYNNSNVLSPETIVLSPGYCDVPMFREITYAAIGDKFCYETIDKEAKRRNVLKELGGKEYDILKLPALLEKSFKTETEWIAKTYALIDGAYRAMNDLNLKSTFTEEFKKGRFYSSLMKK